jgi:hypothetical protein
LAAPDLQSKFKIHKSKFFLLNVRLSPWLFPGFPRPKLAPLDGSAPPKE